MILTQHTSPDMATCAVHESERPAIVIHGSALDFDKPAEVNLNRRHFSFGDQHISLEDDLIADVYLKTGTMVLQGWGINIELYQSDFNLDREIIRKFLTFFSKAEANSLNSNEQAEWMSLVAKVDYQKFCAERSPYVYMEGKLLSRESDGWRVQWHDGSEQLVRAPAGKQLDILDLEQLFGAMVKFGKDRIVLSIASISFITKAAITGEELWQSWPTANS